MAENSNAAKRWADLDLAIDARMEQICGQDEKMRDFWEKKKARAARELSQDWRNTFLLNLQRWEEEEEKKAQKFALFMIAWPNEVALREKMVVYDHANYLVVTTRV